MEKYIKVKNLTKEERQSLYNLITNSLKVKSLSKQEKDLFETIACHHILGQNRDVSSIEMLAKKSGMITTLAQTLLESLMLKNIIYSPKGKYTVRFVNFEYFKDECESFMSKVDKERVPVLQKEKKVVGGNKLSVQEFNYRSRIRGLLQDFVKEHKLKLTRMVIPSKVNYTTLCLMNSDKVGVNSVARKHWERIEAFMKAFDNNLVSNTDIRLPIPYKKDIKSINTFIPVSEVLETIIDIALPGGVKLIVNIGKEVTIVEDIHPAKGQRGRTFIYYK